MTTRSDPSETPQGPAVGDTDDCVRDTVDALVAEWSAEPRLVHVERLSGRPARLARPAEPLHPALEDRLGERPLWSHQARAIDLVRSGRSVVLSTPTPLISAIFLCAPMISLSTRVARVGLLNVTNEYRPFSDVDGVSASGL